MGLAHSVLNNYVEDRVRAPAIEYDCYGRFLRWGPPNHTTLIDLYDRVYRVNAWSVLAVTVFHRNNDHDTRFSLVSHWQYCADFIVERWDQIWPHFREFFPTAGFANRFRFDNIERWIWTSETNWQPADCM